MVSFDKGAENMALYFYMVHGIDYHATSTTGYYGYLQPLDSGATVVPVGCGDGGNVTDRFKEPMSQSKRHGV